MPAHFVNIDRATPMLLPPDLRDWIPQNHIAHFLIDAVEAIPESFISLMLNSLFPKS